VSESALDAVPATPSAADPADEPLARRTGRDLSWWLMCGIICAATCLRVWTIGQWSWTQDDWIYSTAATETDFWPYVLQNYNGHIMPAQFAITWAITRLAPLDFTWAVVIVGAFAAAALVAWAAALRTIFGPRRRAALGLAVLAFSPVYLPPGVWWAAAIQIFPLQLSAGLITLYAGRYLLHGGSRADLVRLTGSLALGMIFWQKAALLIPIIAGLGIMLGPSAWRVRLATTARLLAGPLLLMLAYLPAYIALTRGPDAAATSLFQARSWGQVLSFGRVALLDVALPALFGGPWTWLGSPDTRPRSLPLDLAIMLVVVLGLGLALLVRRRGWAAVALAGGYAAASWGLLLTSSRYDVLRDLIARDVRYAADIHPIAVLAVVFMLTPTVAEHRGGWRRERTHAAALRVSRRVVRTLRVIGPSALVFSLALGLAFTWRDLAPTSPKSWVHAASDSLRAAAGRAVVDSMAPNEVASPLLGSNARLSRMFLPMRLPVAFNSPSTQLVALDAAGGLGPVVVETAAQSAPGPTPDCGWLLEPGQSQAIAITPPLYEWEWVVAVDYYSQLGALATVTAGAEQRQASLPAGLARLQLVVTTSIDRIVVSSTPASGPVCITQVSVGQARPRPSAGPS